MTARQQRRLEQKSARKAAKRARKAEAAGARAIDPTELANAQSPNPTGLAGASTPDVSEEFAGHARAVAGQISPAKIAANVANAQFSTGPITEKGKAIVAQNATKHGLTGKFKVLPCESQSDFDQLLAGFLKSESPVGDDEIEMVHQMAEALWLSRRSVRLQNDCFAALESGAFESAKGADAGRQAGEEGLEPLGGAPETAPVLRARSVDQRDAHKSMALYIRYQTAQDRTFTRYSTELRKRRNERARAERGFVSQKYKEAADRRRQELHQVRQALQNVKRLGQEIRNRLAAAKAEALELKNLARRTQLASQNPEGALAAAACGR